MLGIRLAGALMREAQALFDSHAQPLAAEHLTSPALHAVLGCAAIQGHIWGGKGVGSQASGIPPAAIVSLLDLMSNSGPYYGTYYGGRAVNIGDGCLDEADQEDMRKGSNCDMPKLPVAQGDGTAQLVARGLEDQEAVCRILERDFKVSCTKLTVPAAGGRGPAGHEAGLNLELCKPHQTNEPAEHKPACPDIDIGGSRERSDK